MRSIPLSIVAAVVLMAGCQDGSNPITAPEQLATGLDAPSAASQAAFLAVQEVLADPFTLELVEGAGVDPSAFYRTVRAMTVSDVRVSTVRLSETVAFQSMRPVAAEQTAGAAEQAADARILSAALKLVLDDAVAVVDGHLTNDTHLAAPAVRR